MRALFGLEEGHRLIRVVGVGPVVVEEVGLFRRGRRRSGPLGGRLVRGLAAAPLVVGVSRCLVGVLIPRRLDVEVLLLDVAGHEVHVGRRHRAPRTLLLLLLALGNRPIINFDIWDLNSDSENVRNGTQDLNHDSRGCVM